MDASDEAVLRDIVDTLHSIQRPEWIELHQLRSWHSGERHHIDFHLTLPRYWDLEQGHATNTEIEEQLIKRFHGQSEAIIHLDPCMPLHCPMCRVQDCPVRSTSFRSAPEWTVELAVKWQPG